MKAFLPILFMAIAMSLNAQTTSIKKSPPLAEASPASAGIAAERLKWVDGMLEESIANGEIPGAVALIARNGKIV